MSHEKNGTNFNVELNFNLFCIINENLFIKIMTTSFAFDECSFDQNNGSLFATSGINDFLKLERQTGSKDYIGLVLIDSISVDCQRYKTLWRKKGKLTLTAANPVKNGAN